MVVCGSVCIGAQCDSLCTQGRQIVTVAAGRFPALSDGLSSLSPLGSFRLAGAHQPGLARDDASFAGASAAPSLSPLDLGRRGLQRPGTTLEIAPRLEGLSGFQVLSKLRNSVTFSITELLFSTVNFQGFRTDGEVISIGEASPKRGG